MTMTIGGKTVDVSLAALERRFFAAARATPAPTEPGGCDVVAARVALLDCQPPESVSRRSREAQKGADFSFRYGSRSPDLVQLALLDLEPAAARERLALVAASRALQIYTATAEGARLLDALRHAAR